MLQTHEKNKYKFEARLKLYHQNKNKYPDLKSVKDRNHERDKIINEMLHREGYYDILYKSFKYDSEDNFNTDKKIALQVLRFIIDEAKIQLNQNKKFSNVDIRKFKNTFKNIKKNPAYQDNKVINAPKFSKLINTYIKDKYKNADEMFSDADVMANEFNDKLVFKDNAKLNNFMDKPKKKNKN